jgi:thioredoxin-related protein
MKIILQITLMTLLLIFSSCSKLEKNNKQKEILLIATQNFNNIKEVKRTLTIFSDSTYTFIENLREPNHNKDETFEGLLKINKDSIKFHPFELYYNKAETAVLKNGFIEFIDGENPDRMKLRKQHYLLKIILTWINFPTMLFSRLIRILTMVNGNKITQITI